MKIMFALALALALALVPTKFSFASDSVSGEYKLKPFHSPHCEGYLIVEQSGQHVKIWISTVDCPRNMCDFGDEGDLVDGVVSFSLPEEFAGDEHYEGYKLSVHFKDSRAEVIEEGLESPHCGYNGHLAGKYLKIKSPKHLTLRGKIGRNSRIRLSLTKTGDSVAGSYYYERIKTPIHIEGTIREDEVTIAEFDPKGNQTGVFKGKLISWFRIEGTWSKPDGSKAVDFFLDSNELISGYPR